MVVVGLLVVQVHIAEVIVVWLVVSEVLNSGVSLVVAGLAGQTLFTLALTRHVDGVGAFSLCEIQVNDFDVVAECYGFGRGRDTERSIWADGMVGGLVTAGSSIIRARQR